MLSFIPKVNGHFSFYTTSLTEVKPFSMQITNLTPKGCAKDPSIFVLGVEKQTQLFTKDMFPQKLPEKRNSRKSI